MRMEINKIYNESNLETTKRMPDGFVDLVVTSPPYDDLRSYNGYSFPFEDIATELFRITKMGGVIVWVVGDSTKNGSESGTSFKQALFFKEIGFNLHDTMLYVKNNYIPLTHNRYEQAFEFMFCFSKGKPKTFNPIMIESKTGGNTYNLIRKGYCATIKEGAQRRRNEVVVTGMNKIKSNIFEYNCGQVKINHPAPFPEKLAADQIFSWSNEGDLVYDPFGGSGTTAKMAHLQKRNWILSEISPEYVQLAQKRINPYLNQKTLF